MELGGAIKMTNEERRNKWIEEQLKNIPNGLKILDAGAGQLRWKKASSHLHYVSQDFCQYDGSGNMEGLQTNSWDTDKIDIVSDIVNIPVENNSFDVILCSEVLEHLQSPEMAIKEFSRILREGGRVILTAPFCSLTHMAPYHYCTGFNKYWYETHLKHYGFEIEEIVANGNFFSYLGQELNRLSDVYKLYYSKKNIIIVILSKILSRMLKKYDNDIKSSDLLCFGYQVRARKL